MANLKFSKQEETIVSSPKELYKILLVDDDRLVHEVSHSVINNMIFKHFDIELISAYSAKEAIEYLQENNDVALAFIDVVMETADSGLRLVKTIREELRNELIRLVIRTGQPNDAPQMDVVDQYDIDNYKEKTELTAQKLYTTIRTSIRSYIQLVELQKKYEETYRQMTTNHLTLLPNRLKLQKDLTENNSNVLVLIDIIGFGHINETNGYETGDLVLKAVADFLMQTYAEDYHVYHVEADIFALLLPVSTPDHIEELVSLIKKDISQLRITSNDFDHFIDTTIGVAYQGEKNIIQKAILALNDAKNHGKNQITYYNNDLKIIKDIQNTHYWGRILKKAIENNELIAYYQAIYDTYTLEIIKYEMLIRLKYNNEIHKPYEFMDAAQNSGQLFNIFKFMFTTACQKVSDENIPLSINMGDIELSHPDLMTFINKILSHYTIDTSLITIEVLEHKSISQNPYIKDRIMALDKLGFEITIDDFGTRCSNFSQIENLPVKTLKIDGQYIKNIDKSKNSMIVVETIQRYAKEKELKLVAEFVHSEEVYKKVKDLGIDYVQGDYLHKAQAAI
jgi:diguanylate cyclase (GGDEF)-like protein